MTREEQDKNWNELGKEVQGCVIERYQSYDTSDPVLKAFKTSLEYTYGSHNLKTSLDYEDVAVELFKSGYYFYNYVYDEIVRNSAVSEMPMACTSRKQVEKICAINRLLNVAKFLNKNEDGSDWIPDFKDYDTDFYTLGIDPEDNSIKIIIVNMYTGSKEVVYFRTKEIAEQAVQILGEETIRLAFSNNY